MTLAFISVTIIGHILWKGSGFFGLLTASILSLLFLVSPVLLQAKTGHSESTSEKWWSGDWIEHPSSMK